MGCCLSLTLKFGQFQNYGTEKWIIIITSKHNWNLQKEKNKVQINYFILKQSTDLNFTLKFGSVQDMIKRVKKLKLKYIQLKYKKWK